MTMLFYVLVLCLTSWSVEAVRRSDYVSSITPSTHTNWGSWGEEDWCSEGNYAYGFRLKVERKLSSPGDNTALNAIELLCRNYCGAHSDVKITSLKAKWGDWTTSKACKADYLMIGAEARSEPLQVEEGESHDDTAANNYNFLCQNALNPAQTQLLKGDGMFWGSWTARKDCPAGSYICGIKTEVELFIGREKDNTALNKATFYCCELKSMHC